MFSFDTVSKDLDATIYAAHVRGILLYHITVLQKAVSYGKLAKATGDMPSGGQLAQALARIAEHDHNAGKPLSTAIVVREDTGIPGTGFFNQCRKLGYDILDDPAAEVLFWKKQLNRLKIEEDSFERSDPLSAVFNRTVSKNEEILILSSLWNIPETEGASEKPVLEVDKTEEPISEGSQVSTCASEPYKPTSKRIEGWTSVMSDVTSTRHKFKEFIEAAVTVTDLESFRNQYFGENGSIYRLSLKGLSDEDANTLCSEIQSLLDDRLSYLKAKSSEGYSKDPTFQVIHVNLKRDTFELSEVKVHDPNLLATQKDLIYIPATQLKKGDVVYLPDHVSPFVVESVTQPLFTGDTTRVVRWSSMGRNFETECGSHLRIDMPERLKKATGKPRRRVVSTRLVP